MAKLKDSLIVMEGTDKPDSELTQEQKDDRQKAFKNICDKIGIAKQRCVAGQLIA